MFRVHSTSNGPPTTPLTLSATLLPHPAASHSKPAFSFCSLQLPPAHTTCVQLRSYILAVPRLLSKQACFDHINDSITPLPYLPPHMSDEHSTVSIDDNAGTAIEEELEQEEAAMAHQMRNMATRISELEAVVLALKEEELRNRAKEEQDRQRMEEMQQRRQEDRDRMTAQQESQLRHELHAQQQRLEEQKEDVDRWKQRADQLQEQLNEQRHTTTQPQHAQSKQQTQPPSQPHPQHQPPHHSHSTPTRSSRTRPSINQPRHSRRSSLSAKDELREVTADEVEEVQNTDELHQTIHLLEEEIATLNHRIAVTHTATVLALQQQLHTSQRAMLDMRAERQIDEQVTVMEKRVDEAEEEALRLRCDNLDLTFVVEQSRVKQERIERRLRQVERVNSVLGAFFDASRRQQAGGGLIMNEVEALVREMTTIGAMEGRGIAGGEEEGWRRVGAMDVYEVMHVVKRVVVKLKAEVDELKRRGDGREERDRLSKENKRLEKRVRELEEERERRAAERAEYERISGLHALLKKEVKKEKESADKLKRKVDDLTVLLKERERGKEEDAQNVESEWRVRVEQLERERAGQVELIAAMRAQLNSSIHIAQQLQVKLEEERQARERIEKQGREEKKEKETKHSEHDEHGGELHRELQAELVRVRDECARLQLENAAYASELSAFDESFFDEIEDLKYRYASAVKLLQQMMEAGYSQPQSLTAQTGGFG